MPSRSWPPLRRVAGTFCKWCMISPAVGPTPSRVMRVWAACALNFRNPLLSCSRQRDRSSFLSVLSTVTGEWSLQSNSNYLSELVSSGFIVKVKAKILFQPPSWVLSGWLFILKWLVWNKVLVWVFYPLALNYPPLLQTRCTVRGGEFRCRRSKSRPRFCFNKTFVYKESSAGWFSLSGPELSSSMCPVLG